MPQQPLSERAVYNPRPSVAVDGREHAAVGELLTSLEVEEAEGGMASLEMCLSNVASFPDGAGELAWEDGGVFSLGAELVVSLGDVEDPREVFRGTITGLEARFAEEDAPELVVLAEDALQRARMTRRTALYEAMSPADLAGEIAGRLGLTPRITGLAGAADTRVQLNESDLVFLRRVLAAHDADVQVVGTELHAAPRGEIRRASIDLEMHGQLRSARVLADLSHQVTRVTTAGWDPAQGQRVSATGEGAQTGPGAGRSGAEVLESTLGPRVEHVRDVAVMTQTEAQALADAAFDRRARRFVTVEGTAEGNPALRVGAHLRIGGLGARWDNTYYVVRACHRFDREAGYRTDFEAECAFFGG